MIKYKILFWSATSLFSTFMLFSAYSYLTSEEMKGGFTFLRSPYYFRIELANAKLMHSYGMIMLSFVTLAVSYYSYVKLQPAIAKQSSL